MGSSPITAGSTAIEVRWETRLRTEVTRSSITPVAAIWELSQMTCSTMTTSMTLSSEKTRRQVMSTNVAASCPHQSPRTTVATTTATIRWRVSRLTIRMSASAASTFTNTGTANKASITATHLPA